jgi:hypothetical protein
MPHRNRSERAEWLRQLADSLPQNPANSIDAGSLAMRQTAETLNEIADFILNPAEKPGLPPDTLWVKVTGPALYYYDRIDEDGDVTLMQVRLDGDPGRADEVLGSERERALCRALLRMAFFRFDSDAG